MMFGETAFQPRNGICHGLMRIRAFDKIRFFPEKQFTLRVMGHSEY